MKKLLAKCDKLLLFFTILYAILGLVMVFSASSVSAVLRYGVSPNYFFVKQTIFVVGSFFIGFFIILRMPTSKYKFFTPILIIGIVVVLAGLFLYGVIAGGAQRWYDLGFFSLQPSEYAKPIIIIYMAVYYNRLLKKPKVDTISYLIPLAIAIVIFILVAMQPDFSGAFVIAVITFLIFISVPMPKNSKQSVFKVVGVGVVIAVIALLYSGKPILQSYQMKRLEFREPCTRYTAETGYQVCNSLIAMHNGGLTGLGLGNSTQKYLYLPEAHTDFIFAIIVEELGLIVGILIILGYMFMLYRILRIAKSSENLRCSILAYGTFILIFSHILINLMGVLAIIPLTGLPLPLLSYGGNFTIVSIIMLFVVQRVNIENSINKNKREIQNI